MVKFDYGPFDFRDVIKRLVEMQYERNEIDFSRGKFRVRGDVIDIFPAESSEHALRLTLFDDEVETLSLFDPLMGGRVIKENLDLVNYSVAGF